MKNVTKQELKKATRIAMSYLYGYKNLKWETLPRLDMRYRVSKLVLKIFKENQITDADRILIIQKRRERNLNKPSEFKSIMQNPILIDFFKNRGWIKAVYSDRISFVGRNHWAKSRKDKIVLSILQKMKY